jgi:hypothetical protein
VKQLQQKKDNTEKAMRKLEESRATDVKKQEHAQVRVCPALGRLRIIK